MAGTEADSVTCLNGLRLLSKLGIKLPLLWLRLESERKIFTNGSAVRPFCETLTSRHALRDCLHGETVVVCSATPQVGCGGLVGRVLKVEFASMG